MNSNQWWLSMLVVLQLWVPIKGGNQQMRMMYRIGPRFHGLDNLLGLILKTNIRILRPWITMQTAVPLVASIWTKWWLPLQAAQLPFRLAILTTSCLLPPVPLSTPCTTHRLMLSTELSESLRRNLLWERQVSKVHLAAARRTASGGGSRHLVLGGVHPLMTALNMVQLHPKGTIPQQDAETFNPSAFKSFIFKAPF